MKREGEEVLSVVDSLHLDTASIPQGREATMDGEGRVVYRYALLVAAVSVLAAAGYLGYVVYPRFGLPAVAGAALMSLAVAAGVASFFSPCSFPLLVTLLARGAGGGAFMTAVLLSLGASLFLALVGVIMAAGGETLLEGMTFTSAAGRTVRIMAGLFLAFLGLVQAGVLPVPVHRAVDRVAAPARGAGARLGGRRPRAGVFLFGFLYLVAGAG